MEERQPVCEVIVGRPAPCIRQAVEAGGDRPMRDHRTLGQPGGTRRVHDHRCGVGRDVGCGPGCRRTDRHGETRQVDLGPVGRADDRRSARVTQDVTALGRPGIGGYGHHRHAAAQSGHDGGHGVELGRAADGDGIGPVELRADCVGAGRELAPASRGTVDGDRLVTEHAVECGEQRHTAHRAIPPVDLPEPHALDRCHVRCRGHATHDR